MTVHTNAKCTKATPTTSEEKLILREHKVKAGLGSGQLLTQVEV